jgi:uncharacterized membrane protein
MRGLLMVLILAAIVLTAATARAQSLSTTGEGTIAGGLIGAGSGALVGAAVHHPVVGALVGGGVGAVGGAVVGNQLQNEQNANAQLQSEVSSQRREIDYQRAEIRQLQESGESSAPGGDDADTE